MFSVAPKSGVFCTSLHYKDLLEEASHACNVLTPSLTLAKPKWQKTSSSGFHVIGNYNLTMIYCSRNSECDKSYVPPPPHTLYVFQAEMGAGSCVQHIAMIALDKCEAGEGGSQGWDKEGCSFCSGQLQKLLYKSFAESLLRGQHGCWLICELFVEKTC